MKFIRVAKRNNLETARLLIDQYGKDYIVERLSHPYTKDFIWKLLYRDPNYTESDLGEIRDIILNKVNL